MSMRIMSVWPMPPERTARLLAFHESAHYPGAADERRTHEISDFWHQWVNRVRMFRSDAAMGLLLSAPLTAPLRLDERREFPVNGGGRLARAVSALGSIASFVPEKPWALGAYALTRTGGLLQHHRQLALARRALLKATPPGRERAIGVDDVQTIPVLADLRGSKPQQAFYIAAIVNALAPYLRQHNVSTVLEIGPGLMYVAAVLNRLFGCRFVFVDLPETFNYGYATLSHYLPQATIALPHEVEPLGAEAWTRDFVLLCPEQAHLIRPESIDCAINCSSFQEMTYSIIEGYFALIQRSLRPGGLFYCHNEISFAKHADGSRVEFDKYPWSPAFSDLFCEESVYWRVVRGNPRKHRLQKKAA